MEIWSRKNPFRKSLADLRLLRLIKEESLSAEWSIILIAIVHPY